MSYEADFKVLLDIPLITTWLTGGIYAAGDLSPEGITAITTPNAFDAQGFLKPIAVVKQRGRIPDGWVADHEARVYSFTQVVEIWLYERITYTTLDKVEPLITKTLQGDSLGDSFEVSLVNILDRLRETGVLQDASFKRMDFAINGVLILT